MSSLLSLSGAISISQEEPSQSKKEKNELSLLERLELTSDEEERKYICFIEARRDRMEMLKERILILKNQEAEFQAEFSHLVEHRNMLQIRVYELTIINMELEVKVYHLKKKNDDLVEEISAF